MVGEDGRRAEGGRGGDAQGGVKAVSNKPHLLFSASHVHPTHPTEHVILYTVRLCWTGKRAAETRTPVKTVQHLGFHLQGFRQPLD